MPSCSADVLTARIACWVVVPASWTRSTTGSLRLDPRLDLLLIVDFDYDLVPGERRVQLLDTTGPGEEGEDWLGLHPFLR